MKDSRIRVTKLHRAGPPQNGGWFYWTPDGHVVGPFDYESEMGDDIEMNYKEVGND